MSQNLPGIGIVGAGLMGSGIACKLAIAGHEVLLHDVTPGFEERTKQLCGTNLAEITASGALTAADAQAASQRIRLSADINALRDMPVVFEAIYEVLPAKRQVFARLEQVLAPKAVIASSTSGFTPEALAEGMQRPERFLVAHFWNPPHLIPLVEVLAAAATQPQVTREMVALLVRCNCSPVVLNKAVPGFIGNRLQFAVLREALHLLQEGVADAATIDEVVKQTLGRRYPWVGPLEGADVGGLETFLTISRHLMPELASDERMLQVLQAHVERGEKGLATGLGLYTWDASRRAGYRRYRLELLGRDAQAAGKL